jgi:hypothetical protein
MSKRKDYKGSKRFKVGVMTSDVVHAQQLLIVVSVLIKEQVKEHIPEKQKIITV